MTQHHQSAQTADIRSKEESSHSCAACLNLKQTVIAAWCQTDLSLVNTRVEWVHLCEAEAVHKVVLLPAGHQDRHLRDAGGLCRHMTNRRTSSAPGLLIPDRKEQNSVKNAARPRSKVVFGPVILSANRIKKPKIKPCKSKFNVWIWQKLCFIVVLNRPQGSCRLEVRSG